VRVNNAGRECETFGTRDLLVLFCSTWCRWCAGVLVRLRARFVENADAAAAVDVVLLLLSYTCDNCSNCKIAVQNFVSLYSAMIERPLRLT
jgi:hypothetical protein